MLVTPEANRRNQKQALAVAALVAVGAGVWGWIFPALWLLLGLSPLTYWWLRRRSLRRMAVMQQLKDDWLNAGMCTNMVVLNEAQGVETYPDRDFQYPGSRRRCMTARISIDSGFVR